MEHDRSVHCGRVAYPLQFFYNGREWRDHPYGLPFCLDGDHSPPFGIRKSEIINKSSTNRFDIIPITAKEKDFRLEINDLRFEKFVHRSLKIKNPISLILVLKSKFPAFFEKE